MAARSEASLEDMSGERKSGFARGADRKETLDFSRTALGQSYPQHYPQSEGAAREIGTLDVLGEPLSIRGVARLLGCSVWTVRQRYLPSGLPCFRNGRQGKFVFYRNQVVLWILEKQRQKGGGIR